MVRAVKPYVPIRHGPAPRLAGDALTVFILTALTPIDETLNDDKIRNDNDEYRNQYVYRSEKKKDQVMALYGNMLANI